MAGEKKESLNSKKQRRQKQKERDKKGGWGGLHPSKSTWGYDAPRGGTAKKRKSPFNSQDKK